jgi:hypothetical protein
VTDTRMCVNCGKVVDATLYKPGDSLPECEGVVDGITLSACTFDLTPEEAWLHWHKIAHEQRERIRDLEFSLRTIRDTLVQAFPGLAENPLIRTITGLLDKK